MTHCCSQCDFTANFESALMMHRQLNHHRQGDNTIPDKSSTIPRGSSPTFKMSGKSPLSPKLGRTSSATKLFEKFRSKICRSKTALFSHSEESDNASDIGGNTSSTLHRITKTLGTAVVSRMSTIPPVLEGVEKESFCCHLCNFDADRITVLDRHLLNDHKIGLESLLQLVMSKTKDGLTEEIPNNIYGIRQPYYKPPDNIIETGEFIIETVTPKIKILKHASTNTDIQWSDIPDLKDSCRMITKELEKLIEYPIEKGDRSDFIAKMASLNECMCKFVNSSNTLKKVLKKEFDSKISVRDHSVRDFELGLEGRSTPRDWDSRAHSEKMERRSKVGDYCKGDKKCSSDSYYF